MSRQIIILGGDTLGFGNNTESLKKDKDFLDDKTQR